MTATLSDPNVLPCILGDQPERPSATRRSASRRCARPIYRLI